MKWLDRERRGDEIETEKAMQVIEVTQPAVTKTNCSVICKITVRYVVERTFGSKHALVQCQNTTLLRFSQSTPGTFTRYGIQLEKTS